MKGGIAFLWKGITENRKGLCGLLLMGMADIGLTLVIIGITKRLIDVASGGLPGILWQQLLLLLLCMVGSVLLRGLSSRAAIWQQNNLRNQLMSYFFSVLLYAEWLSMKKIHSGDIMSRMGQDVDGVTNLLVVSIPAFILTFLKLSGAFIYLYIMDAKLALVLAVLVPAVLLLSKLYFKRMRFFSRLLKEQWSGIHQLFQEAVENQEIVKALGAESIYEKKLFGLQGKYMQMVRRQNHFSFYSNTGVMLGFSIGYLLTFSWGLYRLENGTLTFGSLMAFLQLVNMIQGPSLGLAQLVPGLISSYTAVERLNELHDLQPEPPECHCLFKGVNAIEFRNVSFRYQPEISLLEGLNWKFERGKIYALTGKTGCGKTTVVRLLLGFVRPDKGEIWIKGDLNSSRIKMGTRINFAYVPQDCSLFSGSIRNNLKMGKPQATEQEMITALRQAAADFVFDLPNGLDMWISERGGGLSGGQVQRLVIARALLALGNILLLDEFTSALDEDTEYEIITSLKRNVKDKLIIIVSHKQKVIEACDCVYRL